jgi:redox-sensitive bicupin YhaK (pirin superfamily)
MPETILAVTPLGFPWATDDPFLFCVHHVDAYPNGNDRMGPDASLAGRDIGQDFAGKDGWRMYHGDVVPGFPQHPHRGFETVTIVRQGFIDHADSLGATARFGSGDVQWLTAGRGIVHAEMFPLLDRTQPNPLELFQIWLNLPARSKMAAPQFTVFWAERIPRHVFDDGDGRTTELNCIAGARPDVGSDRRLAPPPAPPPDSWAAQPDADVAIWTLKMAPRARWTLPPAAAASTRRALYFFAGTSVTVAGDAVDAHGALELRASESVELINGATTAELLLLQGRPIAEPVAQYGPFVMNTRDELEQAFADYRRTGFGGWPWADTAPVHGEHGARFARHAHGHVDRPADADAVNAGAA